MKTSKGPRYKPYDGRPPEGFRLGEQVVPYQVGPRELQTAKDIIPVAELKANMSEIVRGLETRPRPLVVTLNGKPAAVVMSPREYDLLSYRSRFVSSVEAGLADAAAGRVEDLDKAFDDVAAEFGFKKKPRRSRAK